jgi:hypothetical protein
LPVYPKSSFSLKEKMSSRINYKDQRRQTGYPREISSVGFSRLPASCFAQNWRGGGRLVTFRDKVSGDHVDVNAVESGVLDGAPHPVRLGQSERRLAHHDRGVGGGCCLLHCQDYCPVPSCSKTARNSCSDTVIINLLLRMGSPAKARRSGNQYGMPDRRRRRLVQLPPPREAPGLTIISNVRPSTFEGVPQVPDTLHDNRRPRPFQLR